MLQYRTNKCDKQWQTKTSIADQTLTCQRRPISEPHQFMDLGSHFHRVKGDNPPITNSQLPPKKSFELNPAFSVVLVIHSALGAHVPHSLAAITIGSWKRGR
jgi:hypothetical protein